MASRSRNSSSPRRISAARASAASACALIARSSGITSWRMRLRGIARSRLVASSRHVSLHRAEKVLQLRSRDVEQRTNHMVAPRRHGRQAARSGAARQAQDHGLGLIVARVRDGNAIGPDRIDRLLEEPPPRVASGDFDRNVMGPARPPAHRRRRRSPARPAARRARGRTPHPRPRPRRARGDSDARWPRRPARRATQARAAATLARPNPIRPTRRQRRASPAPTANAARRSAGRDR